MNELRLNELLELDPMDVAFRNFLRPWRTVDLTERAPQIRIDLSETDDQYAVKAEIPGVRKEDIDVRIDGNLVTISAESKSQKEEKEGTHPSLSPFDPRISSSRSFLPCSLAGSLPLLSSLARLPAPGLPSAGFLGPAVAVRAQAMAIGISIPSMARPSA